MGERISQPSLLDPAPHPEPGQAYPAVAQVVIDSPLPHLDRLFDYGVPPDLTDAARVGSRVRVAFAGRHTDAFIITLTPGPGPGDLKPLRRVLGPHPVLTPEVLKLCTAVAHRYAGGLADVLRLAVPPRHARAERELPAPAPAPAPPSAYSDAPWRAYTGGEAFVRHLAAGESPRAVWSALPTPAARNPQEWVEAIVAAAAATVASGRGALILAPTGTEVAALAAGLRRAALAHIELTADLGPAARYRSFLQCLLGHAPVVVGTRAAAFAPVPDLGLVVCWDEVHDAYAEPRAPYPHTREVLTLRAAAAGAGTLLGGFARSPEAQHLVTTGWAHHLGAPRALVRQRTPRVRVVDEYDRHREGAAGFARIPGMAFAAIRRALGEGPVLFQVPRAGFSSTLACAACRNTARCPTCHGPLGADPNPVCSWCAQPARRWGCPYCGAGDLRARTIGARRTAEELGRSFPGVPVRVSGSGPGRLPEVGEEAALVVATPGAEPPAAQGYPLALLLDGHLLTDLPRLTAPVAALHRWLRAAALTRGEVLLLGEPLTAPAQAAVRWDPPGYAGRVLQEWSGLMFPPAYTVVTVTGERPDLLAFDQYLPPDLPVTVLGPVPAPGPVDTPGAGELHVPVRTPRYQLLLRVPAAAHATLVEAVRAAVRTRSARRAGAPLQVKVNPTTEL